MRSFDVLLPYDREEARRAQRFLHDEDRQQFLAGRWLARSILAAYAGCTPAEIAFKITPQGKPQLSYPNGTGLEFSLSHSGGFVAAAIGIDREVGIDIEAKPRTALEDVAPMILSCEENTTLESLPPEMRQAVFLAHWTRKEAVLKAAGTGFLIDPRTVTTGWEAIAKVWVPGQGRFSVTSLAPPLCAAAVAVAASSIRVETHVFSGFECPFDTGQSRTFP